METIICLPVLLLLSLGVAQFAHIWYCRTIVHYAAYCGARAVLTAPKGADKELTAARSAAEIVCAPIAFMNPTGEKDFSLPGITPVRPGSGNTIQGSGAVRNNRTPPDNNVMNVRVLSPDNVNDFSDDYLRSASYTPRNRIPAWHRGVEVEMKVPLLFPFAGPIIGQLATLWDANGNFDIETRTPDNPSEYTGWRTIQHFAGEWTSRICLRERVYMVKPFISTWSDF